MIHFAEGLLLVGVCVAAAGWDLKERRIPNVLTVTGVAAALGLAALNGWSTLGGSILVALAVLLVGSLLFAKGWLGGGDVKLLVFVAAVLPPPDLVLALLLTAVVGGALALAQVIRKGMLLPVLVECRELAARWSGMRSGPYRSPLGTGLSIPYAVAIAAGAIGAWLH
jgi:prepilin peptidase CpaA